MRVSEIILRHHTASKADVPALFPSHTRESRHFCLGSRVPVRNCPENQWLKYQSLAIQTFASSCEKGLWYGLVVTWPHLFSKAGLGLAGRSHIQFLTTLSALESNSSKAKYGKPVSAGDFQRRQKSGSLATSWRFITGFR